MRFKMKKIIALPLICFALSGCMKDYTKMSSDDILLAATTRSSEFDSSEFTFLPSLHASLNRGFLGSLDQIEFALGVSKGKNNEVSAQGLMVKIRYFDTEWRYYNSADFSGGVPAELKIQNSNVSNCSTYKTLATRCNYSEMVSIKLDKEFIKRNQNGFSVRLNSQEGKQNIVTIPENYMNAFANLVK